MYLGPPEAAGNSAVSFGDLLKAGQTDAAGEVTATRLPEGSACAAGNLEGFLNGPRGLDASTAVRIVLRADMTTEAEIRLPLSLGSMGAVRGVVKDPEGVPLRGAQVTLGYCQKITGRDGTFTLPRVPSGAVALSVSRNGYQPARVEVDVPARETAAVEVTLEYDECGTLSLSGTVIGPAGEPVPDANVYLIAAVSGGTGTIRTAMTDAAGRFEMPSLPDRLSSTPARIQATKEGYQSSLSEFPEGLRTPSVELRMPIRLVRLKLAVVDAATGEAQTRCRFEARVPGRENPVASFASRSADGRYEAWLQPGPHEFLIETPDHDPLTGSFDAGPGGGEFSYTARLVATAGPAAEVRLTVTLRSAVDDSPVETAKVEVVDPRTGSAVAALEGERPGGVFVLPAPSGERRLRVTASGFAVYEDGLMLDAGSPDSAVEVRLYPK